MNTKPDSASTSGAIDGSIDGAGKVNDAKKFLAMKAVYSYVFPEVRKIIRDISYLPEEFYLTTTPVDVGQAIVDGLSYKKKIIVPKTSDGMINLDEIHVPIIGRITEEYSQIVHGLENFRYAYPTAGSSPGIFHILAKLKADGIDTIYTLDGEYEGYMEYGLTLGIRTVEVSSLESLLSESKSTKSDIKPGRGVIFISNPSARDGNIIEDDLITKVADNGYKIVMDQAYVGLTKNHVYDLSHVNHMVCSCSG